MAFRSLVERAFPSFEFPTRPSVQTIDERIAAIDPEVHDEIMRRGRAAERIEQLANKLSTAKLQVRESEHLINAHYAREEQRRVTVRQAVHGYSPCCTPERGAFDTEREYREAYARANELNAARLAAKDALFHPMVAVNMLSEPASQTLKAALDLMPARPPDVTAAVEAALAQAGIGYFNVDFRRVEANAGTASEPLPELVEA